MNATNEITNRSISSKTVVFVLLFVVFGTVTLVMFKEDLLESKFINFHPYTEEIVLENSSRISIEKYPVNETKPTSKVKMKKVRTRIFKRVLNDKNIIESVTNKPIRNISEDNDLEYIFFEHIRKSGGTTTKEFLYNQFIPEDIETNEIVKQIVNYTDDKKNKIYNNPGIVIHSERRAFSTSCLKSKQRNNTLFVTVIRDPLQRHQSEFVYSRIFAYFCRGLSKATPNESLKLLKKVGLHFNNIDELDQYDYGKVILDKSLSNKQKFAVLMQNTDLLYLRILNWLNKKRDDRDWGVAQIIGDYLPNNFVRFHSGQCECLCLRDDVAPLHIAEKTAIDMHRFVTGCPEGERVLQEMTEKELKIAKNTIDEFDLALPFEILYKEHELPSLLNLVAQKKNLKFRFRDIDGRVREKSSSHAGLYYSDIYQFPDIKERIFRENELDVKLHQYTLEKFEKEWFKLS